MTMMGVDEFLPTSEFMEFMGQTLCNDESLFQSLCSNVLFLIAGFDSQQLNEVTLLNNYAVKYFENQNKFAKYFS